MRVAFYTNATATDSLPVLERLSNCPRQQVVRVYLYDTLKEAKRSPLKILREFGWRRVLQKLVQISRECCGRVVGRIWRLSPKPARNAREWAERCGVPCRLVADLNRPEFVTELREEKIDVLLVCICKNILRQNVLDVPRVGVINIHPSLLPKYRGPLPIFWMLYHGESQAGVTFQWMTERIDAGPIVAQFPVALDARRSEAEISRELFALAADRIEAVLSEVSVGTAPTVQQVAQPTEVRGSYFSYPTKEEVRELERRQRVRRQAEVRNVVSK